MTEEIEGVAEKQRRKPRELRPTAEQMDTAFGVAETGMIADGVCQGLDIVRVLDGGYRVDRMMDNLIVRGAEILESRRELYAYLLGLARR